MDHKNFCPCSAALIASTCAAPIPFFGPSPAPPVTPLEATIAAVTAAAAAGLDVAAEPDALAALDASPRPFPDSTSRLESAIAGFAVEAGGIAGETSTAAEEEFGHGAIRTAAPEEETGWAADTAGVARAGREMARELP